MRFRVSVQAALAAAALTVVLAQPSAAQRQSSVQCPDNSTVLISKDVGQDRWAISYRPSTGVTTGNVYTADGGAIFLKCDRRGLEQGQVILSCSTGTGCSDTECPAFEPIGGEIPIACSFFTAPCSKVPSPFSSNAICSGSPPRPPYDSEASCQAFAEKSGCYQYTYEPGSCSVRYCCTQASCLDP